jgi:hypothetical protein
MKKILLLTLLFILAACSPNRPDVTPTTDALLQPTAVIAETAVEQPAPEATSPANAPAATEAAPTLAPTPRPTLGPDDWMTLPVVPEVSDTAREIYQRGLEMGNDPHRFSKIGDCQNVNTVFLGVFADPDSYRLGTEYAYLQDTIDYFGDSFTRQSVAVQGGFNVAAELSPLRADKSVCDPMESPLACELRLNHPGFAIISLEQWWGKKAEDYDTYMRQIVEYTIAQGVVPILATKADNVEGDNSINRVIAQIAYDYDIPLWNFWAATYPLPSHGLATDDPDHFHLTPAQNFFDDPVRMQSARPVRNLTALQVLDAVRRGVTE